jgi:tRNA modification GTPase
MNDTIFAVSSGAPPAAIAVIRLSGPNAFAAVEKLAGTLPPPRAARLRVLRDPRDGGVLDRALVLLFPGPASASGEDIAELHLHGGRAVVRAVEAALSAMPDCRAAEAGEFTRRALENGRIDLTEAEGLADLLAADSERQRRAAILASEGVLRRRIEAWTDRVVALSAAIEAAVDHSDEDDLADESAIVRRVADGAMAIAVEIDALLAQPPVERLRDGIRVVLAGPPNSGKSTLLNAMAGREAAIVSPIAGTTRDRIEAPIMRGGIAWILTDTAGLTETTADPIERIGVERARATMADADIVAWLGDGPAPTSLADPILVHARCDAQGRGTVPHERIPVSGTSVGGDAPLWDALEARASELLPPQDVPSLNARQRASCRSAALDLRKAASQDDPLFVAEHLRATRTALDRITGRAGVEEVLDALFGQFCIGK